MISLIILPASEQVPSAVGLGVLMEKDNTVRQGGRIYHSADAFCRRRSDRSVGKKSWQR